ncbi:DUF1501 domain-containing protein [Ramlibacter ginsenosidimutans]|uniref:DUF1501 domain-containing protein n=1 Tax=Ramlibacter ginsenosidimutans TaxID=502333 RepID=A0A934WNC0_9BURK|nr:DUF1501 domain-containing protein [Ramlibacter ginsenosidimutans]MBK6008719.1 DUF1501 domain-containing protein [Ramlibacter ginsenosidimutans]
MKRRAFAVIAAAAPLASLSGRLFAAPAAQSRFLLVFLRGGYDAASLLVPHASSFYYEVRPNIAIGRPSAEAASAIGLDGAWGLHPALRDSLGPMLARRELAFVPFAGTEDLSRSHFQTQDSIELGQPLSARRDYRSGFMGRLAQALAGSAPIAFTDQLPLAFQGSTPVPNVSLRSVGKPGLDARQSAVIESMYRGTPWAHQVAEGFAVRDDVARELVAEMEAASRNAISAKGFELEARRIAHLMRERYTLGFVDVGGWDTHVGQGAATGYLASRFEELGRGLAAFAQEMGTAWAQTTVVVVSEFGRTFRENGNRGTDHGHGGVMWVLGGATKPVIAGDQVELSSSTLFQNRDWRVLNDYRAVLSGIFATQFGMGPATLEKVFPGVAPKALHLA